MIYHCHVTFRSRRVIENIHHTRSSAMKRFKMSSKHSKSVFRRGATRVHPKNNIGVNPMRGGIRL